MSLLDFDKILNYIPAPSLKIVEHKLISSDFLKTSLKPPTILPEPWFFQISHLTLYYVVFWSLTIGVSSNLWICRQNFSRQSSLLFQWLRRRVFERQDFSNRTSAFTNLSEWFFVKPITYAPQWHYFPVCWSYPDFNINGLDKSEEKKQEWAGHSM